QPPVEAGRLLPPERRAGHPQPSAAGAGLLPGAAPPAALGRPAAGAGAATPTAPGLRPGDLAVLAARPRPDAGGAAPIPGGALGMGRAGRGRRGGARGHAQSLPRTLRRGGERDDPAPPQAYRRLGPDPGGLARGAVPHPDRGPSRRRVPGAP